MEGSNHAVPADIENQYILESSMREELGSLSPLSSSGCIYRVPERLRRVNENAYTPNLVSIGPLHHGEKALEAMEEHKKRYLQDFLCWTKVSLEDYITKIRDQEARLRSCYPETIKFSSDEFVRIILVDATFIIALLLRFDCVLDNENDRIFGKPMIVLDLLPDLLLLENQLPFFILEDLFDLQETTLSSDSETRLSITDRFLALLTGSSSLVAKDLEVNKKRISSSPYKAEHFLDLIRLVCQPLRSEVLGPALTIPSITDLLDAGVKLQVMSSENGFDIRFSNGILEISKMIICDDTEISFRNLTAFEQCHCMLMSCCAGDFMNVMSRLVKSPKDVDLLVEHKIVENILGDSSQVVTLFSSIGIGVYPSQNFTFRDLGEGLNKYCSLTWPKMMTNLRQNYFNTPWAAISVIAAVILLILTIIQTVCSIMSVADEHGRGP
ncbi:UPF0481 protein At3g47200-like [Prunus avium]|uniref:UPF0481 protein At3g47200-like n=1 Tax=Prunus avium TaxID=42229 RepID=A0A6P5RPU9_PRUAV|nr:UPF0481 protein At3g47200-like [Prunus avium]